MMTKATVILWTIISLHSGCKPKPNFIGRHGSLHIKNN